MSLVSYIMSQENFNKNDSALLINKLGSASKYIETCIHGNGDISKELGLGDSLDSFEQINTVDSDISVLKNNFTSIKNSRGTYYTIKEKLKNQVTHKDVKMYYALNPTKSING